MVEFKGEEFVFVDLICCLFFCERGANVMYGFELANVFCFLLKKSFKFYVLSFKFIYEKGMKKNSFKFSCKDSYRTSFKLISMTEDLLE